jgi:predicted AlkP superfamily pyrophosphatase or phosphodiesterase
MRTLVGYVGVVMALAVLTLRADSAMVILISIDGFAAYHLKNAELDLPHIRALAAAGVETESSETVFPSVTHPSHTTLVTGVLPRRHGVLSNRVTNRETGERFHVTNMRRTDIVQVPTLFDAAKKKGLGTAAFYWPETRDDPSIDYNVPEVFAAENVADIDAVPTAVMADLREAGVRIDDYYAYYGHPFLHGASDFALAEAAAHAITTRQPALTAIHLLMTDVVQHEVGPRHYRSQAALTTADAAVGLMVKAVQDAGLSDRTTFIVGADHGFATVEWQVNVAPAFAGSTVADKVTVHPQGWSLFVELKPEFDAARDQAALDEVLARAQAIDGVARIVRPEEFHALGLPTYDESPYIRGHYMIVGEIDTYVAYKPEDASTARTPLTEAHHGHGYLPEHPDMYPVLVLSGRGVAQGKKIGHVRNLDVAPTIARLLGLDMPDVDGRVLTEALR